MSPFRRVLLSVFICAAAVYGLTYIDLNLRARSAYVEGEKYLRWHADPSQKKAHWDGVLAEREKNLRKDFSSGKISSGELEQKLFLARFERDQRAAESSLKYAYVWFQTAVELFSPPESRWVVLSRQKMGRARELWKKELDVKKIPYKDYMLE